MKLKPKQTLYKITIEFPGGIFRTVNVKGSTREIAEHRALKHNPNSIGVKRDAV